jgi:hypothetical protein
VAGAVGGLREAVAEAVEPAGGLLPARPGVAEVLADHLEVALEALEVAVQGREGVEHAPGVGLDP